MIKTAMILCAGFGTRLSELTKNLPKPMLSVSGKPILEYTIRHLQSLGVENIIINLHYLHEKITDYFGDGKKFNVKITYSYEETPLGTAGAVKKVENILSQHNNFFVIYGDIFTNERFDELYKFHTSKSNPIASIILHERNSSNSVVEMDKKNLIYRFIERPNEEVKDKKQNWVNSGLYCFNKKILDYIPSDQAFDFPKDVFGKLVLEKSIYGYPLKNYRCAIDSLERFEKANSDFINNKIKFDFLPN